MLLGFRATAASAVVCSRRNRFSVSSHASEESDICPPGVKPSSSAPIPVIIPQTSAVFAHGIRLRRRLAPAEIAVLARCLVSDEAQRITGQAINLSAGRIAFTAASTALY
jgi:hypothetical protein